MGKMNQPLEDFHLQGLKNSENCQLAHELLKDKFKCGRAGAAEPVELTSWSAFQSCLQASLSAEYLGVSLFLFMFFSCLQRSRLGHNLCKTITYY